MKMSKIYEEIPDKNPDFYKRKIDTVLFDFDGTLINTDSVIIKSFRYTLSRYGVKSVTDEKLFADFGGLLVDIMAKYKAEFSLNAPLEELIACYRDYHHDIFREGIICFDGIPELLQNLRLKGYKLAVLTSRKRRTTDIGLEKFSLGKYFDAVQTADDCPYAKPDPRAAEILLEKIGSDASRAAIIGDSAYDIGCGKNCGMLTVFATWGRDLQKSSYGADFFAKKPADVAGFLEKFR